MSNIICLECKNILEESKLLSSKKALFIIDGYGSVRYGWPLNCYICASKQLAYEE